MNEMSDGYITLINGTRAIKTPRFYHLCEKGTGSVSGIISTRKDIRPLCLVMWVKNILHTSDSAIFHSRLQCPQLAVVVRYHLRICYGVWFSYTKCELRNAFANLRREGRAT